MSENHAAPDCAQAIEWLHSYIDGELDESDLDTMRIHLDQCPPCGDAHEFERSLHVVISTKCAETIPPDLRDKLIALVVGESGKSTGSPAGP